MILNGQTVGGLTVYNADARHHIFLPGLVDLSLKSQRVILNGQTVGGLIYGGLWFKERHGSNENKINKEGGVDSSIA